MTGLRVSARIERLPHCGRSWWIVCGMVIGMTSAATAGPNCRCRAADGHQVEVGETACIRGKLARCEMFLNNSSWKFTDKACPQSSIAPRPILHPALQFAEDFALMACRS